MELLISGFIWIGIIALVSFVILHAIEDEKEEL
jgi:hypothetical protein